MQRLWCHLVTRRAGTERCLVNASITSAVVLQFARRRVFFFFFATPVLDLMRMPLQHINNADHEKPKYTHHKAPIYTQNCTNTDEVETGEIVYM